MGSPQIPSKRSKTDDGAPNRTSPAASPGVPRIQSRLAEAELPPAIPLLRQELLRGNRQKAWEGAVGLTADLSLRREIVKYLAEIKTLEGTKPPRPYGRGGLIPRVKDPGKKCSCGLLLLEHPPKTRKALTDEERRIWNHHFKSGQSKRENRIRWGRIPRELRFRELLPAARTLRAKREARWLAEINPRLVQVLGAKEALHQHLLAWNRTHRPSYQRSLEAP